MTKDEIIRQIADELMFDDEYLEYYEAMTRATNIYENMFKDYEDAE